MGVLDWLHRRHREPTGETPRCPQEVLEEAEQRRREAYARWPLVNAVAARVDDQGRRNHFGETVDRIYRRKHA